MHERYKGIVITGGSATGKTTLVHDLIATLECVSIIEAIATRSPRCDDRKGEYRHVSFLKFCMMLFSGEFVSWIKLSSNIFQTRDFYAIKAKSLKDALDGRGIFVRSLIPRTIPKWHAIAGNEILFIHLSGPDENEVRRRMTERGGMTQEQISKRIKDEKNWNQEIDALIKKGIPIHIIPPMPPKETLDKVLEIL